MTNQSVTLVMAMLVSAIGVGVILGTISVSPRPQNQAEHPAQKFKAMNIKAHAAKTGEPNAVSALADDVINNFGTPESASALSVFKDRLVRAEIEYRQKGKVGIAENTLSNEFNRLAKAFDAPKYAYVNVAQIRYLRLTLLLTLPNFIGQLTEVRTTKLALNPEMSPLEAFAITELLVTQKLSNPEFQVSPTEWIKNQHQNRLAERATSQDKGAAVKSETELISFTENDKTKALKQLVLSHTADLLPSIDRYLNGLGISN